MFQTHLVWPSDRRFGEPRTIERIHDTISMLDDLNEDEKEGITGRSPLLDYPGFQFIAGVPCEYMHHVCLGVTKRLIELTFNVGDNRKRITKRKLCNPKHFNDIMATIKVPCEFSRRGRSLDFKVMKAEEFRNIVLFYFDIVVQCISSTAQQNYLSDLEQTLWYVFAFQIRALVLPKEEYCDVAESDIKYTNEKFMTSFENLYGTKHSSYNIHMMCHLNRVRDRGPLTETSTFPTESYYSEMRRSYVTGTAATGKQILQNAYIKRQLPHVHCRKSITYRPDDTSRSCNKYMYIYRNNNYEFYLFKSINDNGSFNCVRQGKRSFNPLTCNNVNWSTVGVFTSSALDTRELEIHPREITGKAMMVLNLIMSCPTNILQE